MLKGFGHCAFRVKDMKRSLEFYEGTLGFKKAFEINRDDGTPWIVYVYAGNGQFVELFYGGTETQEYSDQNIGFFHLCVQVEDINETWKRIVESGAPQDEAPKMGSDYNRQCWTRDPDGNKLEMMQISENSPQMKIIREFDGI